MRQVKKRNIRLSTDRYLVRTLFPTDACEDLARWLADPELMQNVNMQPQKLTRPALERYIGSFDQSTRLFLGVFADEGKKLVGYYLIDINPGQRRATFNVVIGNRDYWGNKTVLETRAVIMDYMFERAAVDKLIGGPLARNFPAIFNYKAQGWRLEGIMKGHVRSATGAGRIDQYQFGMLKDEWERLRSSNANQAQKSDIKATPQ